MNCSKKVNRPKEARMFPETQNPQQILRYSVVNLKKSCLD